MAENKPNSVDEYISSQPEGAQTILNAVRRAIRTAVPDAEESISYKMPTYKLKGRIVLYFAGWKRHYSLYPADAQMVAAFKDELTPFVVEKGTIRFPLAEVVPVELIARLADFRANEITERDPLPTARSEP